MSSPLTEPSLCIPRVFDNIPWKVVKGKFEEEFRYGVVDRVDMIRKVDDKGQFFKRVFIHFKKWNVEDEYVNDIRLRLMNGGEVMETYQKPWYWKISASRLEKPSADQLPKSPHVPRKKIQLNSLIKTKKPEVVGGVSVKRKSEATTDEARMTPTWKYELLMKEVEELQKAIYHMKEKHTSQLEEKDKIISELKNQVGNQ